MISSYSVKIKCHLLDDCEQVGCTAGKSSWLLVMNLRRVMYCNVMVVMMIQLGWLRIILTT